MLGRATRALPSPDSKEHLRLRAALKQFDGLYVLATRLVVQSDAFDGTAEVGTWTDLVDRARRLRENGSGRAMRAFEGDVRKLWREITSQRLKSVAELMDGLYGSLCDRGLAFLSFGPDDAGVVPWEKLLRYWESSDGGQFQVTRVDLEDGGHLMILQRSSPASACCCEDSRARPSRLPSRTPHLPKRAARSRASFSMTRASAISSSCSIRWRSRSPRCLARMWAARKFT